MLKKLLKYEYKSVSRILVPAILGTIALALLTAVLFKISYTFLPPENEVIIEEGVVVGVSITNNILSVILLTLLIFSIIAIIASVFVIGFILLQRYYKNFFGDEGYLTFTLPVKTSAHLTAKLISGVFWMLLGGIGVVISVFVLVVFGTAEKGQIINKEVLDTFSMLFKELFEMVGVGDGVAYIIELVLLILIQCIAQMLLFYLAITLGSIIAKKHKVLTSVGMYLGINAAAGTIINIIAAIVFGKVYITNNLSVFANSAHLFFILFIVLYSVISVVVFILINDLLRRKLNLE